MRVPDIVLPRRVFHQPDPHLNPGGDCGACVLGGLTNRDPKRIYDELFSGKPVSVNYHMMHQALRDMYWRGLLDRILLESPVWFQDFGGDQMAWGLHGNLQSVHWVEYLRLGFDSGHYAVANVDTLKGGPFGRGPNHWVLLCGLREVEIPHPSMPGVSRYDIQVLVSCSSSRTPDEEWVEVEEFLRERGGFNVILARPTST